ERNRKVALEQSKGRAQAEDIKSRTEAEVSISLEQARARSREARARADAQADRTLNRAIRADPDYYAELKKREIGELGLDGKKRVWSTRLFDLFFPHLGRPGAAMPGADGGKGRDKGGR